jgi:hypothetical protein
VDIPLVVGEEQYMIFQLRNANMPQVKVLAKVLQHLRLNPNLGLFERNNLFKQRFAKL